MGISSINSDAISPNSVADNATTSCEIRPSEWPHFHHKLVLSSTPYLGGWSKKEETFCQFPSGSCRHTIQNKMLRKPAVEPCTEWTTASASQLDLLSSKEDDLPAPPTTRLIPATLCYTGCNSSYTLQYQLYFCTIS